jgi:hypothetical protein
VKITEIAHIFGLLQLAVKFLCINQDKEWVGLHFGRIFLQTHLFTLRWSLSLDERENAVRVARWFVFKPKIPNLGNFWRAFEW